MFAQTIAPIEIINKPEFDEKEASSTLVKPT